MKSLFIGLALFIMMFTNIGPSQAVCSTVQASCSNVQVACFTTGESFQGFLFDGNEISTCNQRGCPMRRTRFCAPCDYERSELNDICNATFPSCGGQCSAMF